MPVKQAEAISVAIKDLVDSSELATKSDIKDVMAEMKMLEMRMTIKVAVIVLASLSAFSALKHFL